MGAMMRISGIGALILAAWLVLRADPAVADPQTMRVYKSLTCGCCQKWVDYLRGRGYAVTVSNVLDIGRVKQELGVPSTVASCHTAVVGGYFIEGHVPEEDIARLLAERPSIAGLAVSGMPVGAPGMEGPDPQAYYVFAVQKDGKVTIFAEHRP
jgi:hypothetical protein